MSRVLRALNGKNDSRSRMRFMALGRDLRALNAMNDSRSWMR